MLNQRFLFQLIVMLAALAVVLASPGGWAEDEGEGYQAAYQWDDREPAVDLELAGTDILVEAGQFSLRFGINGHVEFQTYPNRKYPFTETGLAAILGT